MYTYYRLALLLDALGHRDDAMAELERAVEENSATLYMLDVDPKLEPLRADVHRRFQPLRNKMFGVELPNLGAPRRKRNMPLDVAVSYWAS